ncbi:hypothetical protein JCM3775_001423 [Rhodotorula graminis]|uniref:MAF1 protein n=1 Tax=Rhodotorula graminis (strain WP1) TaxID=578459 RepID=A0A194S7A5_RHOGW|nr:uncharacterized protein RHOBADRAFT_52396 [Rhodotorula graminis WP1]KPV76380.1 hypothetical protein RHOBADRAFT_52396 [Rhodotorula graminis WP1]
MQDLTRPPEHRHEPPDQLAPAVDAPFLEIPELSVLSNALSMSTPTLKVSTRIEAYSCKQVSKERKLFKTLESELIQDLTLSTSHSPPEHHQGLLESPFGPLDQPQSRKTLWLLIGLLNIAFPDYDFSKVRPEDFRREEGPRAVLTSLSTALDQLRSPSGQRPFASFPGAASFGQASSPYSDPVSLPGTTPTDDAHSVPTNPFLRQVLDPIIDLSDCECFTYSPDIDSDPHAAESDSEGDDESGEFEDDDADGMALEMEGVPGVRRASTPVSGRSTPSFMRAHRSPMKSIQSVFGRAGTPFSNADSANEDEYGESSTGGLLWSTFQFLYNRKAKRIVFINSWARTPHEARRSTMHHHHHSSSRATHGAGARAWPMSTGLKRSASNVSVASVASSSIPLAKKKVKGTAV